MGMSRAMASKHVHHVETRVGTCFLINTRARKPLMISSGRQYWPLPSNDCQALRAGLPDVDFHRVSFQHIAGFGHFSRLNAVLYVA